MLSHQNYESADTVQDYWSTPESSVLLIAKALLPCHHLQGSNGVGEPSIPVHRGEQGSIADSRARIAAARYVCPGEVL